MVKKRIFGDVQFVLIPQDKPDIQKINNLRVINDFFTSSPETHLITHHNNNNNNLLYDALIS